MENFAWRYFYTASISHKDTFARIDFFLVLIFLFTITVTPNLQSVTFIFFNQFYYIYKKFLCFLVILSVRFNLLSLLPL